MAECIFCKHQIPYYNGYPDGGCKQLEKRPLPLALDGVCECFEMIDYPHAYTIAREHDREIGLKYLIEIVNKREESKKIHL